MSKRLTKVLSLVLTLVMFLSVSTPAFAWGGGDLGGGWDRDIGEDEIRDFDGPVVEEEDEPLDFFHFLDEETLKEVTVEAPMGSLPTLAELRVETVEVEDIREAVESVVEGEANILVALDISFWLNGVEIEPEEPVRVKIGAPELDGKNNLTLVHIPDAEEPETLDLIDDEDLSFSLGTNEIAFQADSFSVYAIISGEEGTDDDQPYRTTYEFYNADESEYFFKDAAGRDMYTQILKDGEKLEDVGIPTQGASQNAKFVGWYVWNADGTLGDKVEVGENKTVTKNETIRLKAKLQGIVNVMFVTAVMKDDQGQPMARSIVTVEQVEYTVGQAEPITVDTKGFTTDAPTNEQAVVGWNRNEDAANAGTVEGTNGVITLFADGNDANIGDVTLFPAIQNAYWLYFDENDGGTGGGASYTPPQFVTIGGKPTEPTPPHRAGYTFGGWYKDAACTQEFDFNEPLTATTTVYAKWVGSDTTYTVIVLVQKTADSAKVTSAQNLPHDSKTYDFYAAYTENAKTGDTVSVANSYTRLANTIDNSGHIKYETCDAAKTVAADGSTILYVYYQRDVMTIIFRTNNSVLYTWYGLYDATFEESGKTWDSNYTWRSTNYVYTFLDSFKSFDRESDTSLTLYRGSESGSATITFLKEKLDGSWEVANSFHMNANSSFTLSSKYTGFTLSQYSTNGSSWNTASEDQTVSYGYYLYIRNTRNTYNIEYHNGVIGAEGTVVRTDGVKYEAPLADHQNPTVTYPVAADADHYEFIGWFADSGWKTMVTFTELDEQTKTNYKNWYGIAEFVVIDEMPSHNFPLYAGYALKGWDCALDPNGGEFTNASQAGVFWLQYGEKFSADLKTNIKREGYAFQGWMVASVNGDLDIVTRNNLRFVGDNSNWTASENPWQFDQGITGPTYLQAKWFYLSTMSVFYDANGGTNAPEDKGAYSDHANTVAFHAPNAPEGKNFLGWDIVGTDAEEKLQPGATFEVNSEYAVDGVVTLKAVYHEFNPEEEVPVTHIDWYANNTETAEYVISTDPESGAETKETQPLHVTDADLQINNGRPIRPADTFKNSGYVFLGWAKLHKDGETLKDHKGVTVEKDTSTGADMDYVLTEENLYLKYEDGVFKVESNGEWKETSQVAADEHLPYDDMYAVWDLGYFYVYHTSDNTIEKVGMEGENWDKTNDTYNITALLPTGVLYGGYYKDYDGAAIKAEGFDPSKFDFTAEVKDADGTPYEPNKKTAVAAEFDINLAYTESGLAMKPVANTLYFLKEVPAASYLQPYFHYTYHKDTKKISTAWLISDIDDTNYTETGFFVTQNEKAEKICSSLTVQNKVGGASVKLTAATIFRAKDVKSALLSYLTIINGASPLLNFSEDAKLVQYWITPDNLIVTGTTQRIITGFDSQETVAKTDSAVAMTIVDAKAGSTGGDGELGDLDG